MPSLSHALRHAPAAAFALLLIAAIPLSWPRARTAAYVAPPPFTLTALRDGSFTKGLEPALQETSWLAERWRSLYAETAYRLGVLDSAAVALGREQWLFLRESLALDFALYSARVAERDRFLVELRRYVDRLGVTLVVVIAPDKERLYPEQIYPDRRMPAGRDAIYPSAVAQIRAAGFVVVDLHTPLAASRRARPDVLLYHPRDTHWTLEGAVIAARAVDAALRDAGLAAQIGAPVPYHPTPLVDHAVVGDLLPMLGFAPDGRLGGLPKMPDHLFALWLHGRPLEVAQPQARLALCGTSFSDVHFGLALCAATRVAIDREGVRIGGGAFAGLFTTLAAIAGGDKQARVVVWEFVERQLLYGWRHLPPLPR